MLFKIAFTTSSAIWMNKVEQISPSVKFKMALAPMSRLYLLKQSYLQKMQNAPEKKIKGKRMLDKNQIYVTAIKVKLERPLDETIIFFILPESFWVHIKVVSVKLLVSVSFCSLLSGTVLVMPLWSGPICMAV